jgi:hypothetical protein
MKEIADGISCRAPATIDDPTILEEITEAFAISGYPRTGAGLNGGD